MCTVALLLSVVLFNVSVIISQIVKVQVASYNVEIQELNGEAEFKRAEQNKKILIEQARAERDAASLRAEAIEIVGAAAQQYPEYRLQEFLGAFGSALTDQSIDKIIFVPTEANIPITEAGRTVK